MDIKDEKLGMNWGSAMHLLKKGIIFKFTQRLELDTCLRCNKKIETLEEFSIDHKEDWLYAADPYGTFFNLDNIAFSHIVCNQKAGTRNQKRKIFSSTGFKGVEFKYSCNRTKPYKAMISKEGKRIHIGYYLTPQEAAAAYDVTARSFYGERAVTNKSLGLL